MNSIIVTNRNRKDSVKLFLESFVLASKNVKPDSYEIIICDLSSTDNSREIINSFKDVLRLKLLEIEYSDVFYKTKALNNCVRASKGNLITSIDIDSIVLPNFLSSIAEFFSHKSNNHNKLAHRVRYLNTDMSFKMINKQVNLYDEIIETFLIDRYRSYPFCPEKFTSNELNNNKATEEMYKNEALGNSHYTMFKEDFLAIGGYDERFIGHGLEDLDFNLRAFKYLKRGTLRTEKEFTIFHIDHSEKESWDFVNYRMKNRKQYRNNKENNVICLPITNSWGKF